MPPTVSIFYYYLLLWLLFLFIFHSFNNSNNNQFQTLITKTHFSLVKWSGVSVMRIYRRRWIVWRNIRTKITTVAEKNLTQNNKYVFKMCDLSKKICVISQDFSWYTSSNEIGDISEQLILDFLMLCNVYEFLTVFFSSVFFTKQNFLSHFPFITYFVRFIFFGLLIKN